MTKRILLAGVAFAALCGISAEANASLVLTAAGISNGFTITTFANVAPGSSGCCNGPFGMAVTNNGNVLVSSGGTLYTFANTDGQTQASALFTRPSNSFTASYASVGGQAYGWQNSQFVQFNNDGSTHHVLTGVAVGPYLGAWGNPVTGKIIASSGSGIVEINPLANGGLGDFRVINSVFPDGVSVSADGLTFFAQQGSCINSYSIASGASTGSACGFNSPDGTGIIIGGTFNGDLIVNNNNGDVDLYDFDTGTKTTIATGTSPFGFDRGDYTQPDQKGCLFLAEGDRVDRLCVEGGSIGVPVDVPEPGTLAVFGVALLGLALRRRLAA